ncbi:MAG: response regulator, partial [Pseudomonadota bacterium]
MRILIIEDDCLFSEILQTFLEDNGCSTILAGTLGDAKVVLSATVFDFILVDNHLPDGDGINFIDTIKCLVTLPTPIMMITGEDNQNVMAEVFEKGADDYLVKPISLDLLWLKIQRVQSLYIKEAKLADQRNELDRLLGQKNSEDELARYVYEHVASDSVSNNECVEFYGKSSSTFSGDVFISESAPNGNRFIILADATGHGLAAAISTLPLIATINAMIRKGLSLAHIVHEANTKLGKELPDDRFVALIGIEISFITQTLSVFNGGMPD